MVLYTFFISLTVSLFFTACQSTPNVPLSPELDKYALIKENCEGLRIIPGMHVPDALDKECRTFLRRLDKANAIDYKVAHFNDDNSNPNAKPKPEYILLQTDAHRQHRKTEVEYQTFHNTINQVSLESITHNELEDVELTLTFQETEFTKKHYDYYLKQTPQHRETLQYLAFEKKYAKELISKGLDALGQGDKKRAIKNFKSAASLNNLQAAYLVAIIYEAKNIDKAITWHTKAIENGITGSRLNLARLYNRKREPKESQRLYIEAAEDGDAYAQFALYQLYKKTDNTKTNAMAKEWVKRSAENGFPPAEYAYGRQLLQEKNRDEAKEWLIKAHEHGVRLTNATLGAIYFAEKQYKQAYVHLSNAKSGYAKYQLAKMYEHGLGIEVNFYKAYMLYKEALKLGRKKAKKDVARLAKLKTNKEQAHYDAAKQKEKQRLKASTLRNGEEPILRNIRTKGMAIHLQGLVTLPLKEGHGFIVHSEEGKQFYVIDSREQADVKQYQYIDIVTKATGHAITVSNETGLTTDIYQFTFKNHTQH